jgi:ferredoxin, 2Fe-2S
MVKVTFVEHSGGEHIVEAEEGRSLMEIALDSGVPGIVADCGGALSCATCHVHVRPDWFEKVGAPDAGERDMLEMAIDPDETSRLSCCIRIIPEFDGLVVIVPASQF